MKSAKTLLFLFFIPATLFLVSCQEAPAPPVSAHVRVVLDGDSLVLDNGMEVRLIGVDAPEHRNEARNRENARRLGVRYEEYAAYSDKAREFLKALTEGREVRIEYDETHAAQNHRDKYGRYLVYLRIPDLSQPHRYQHVNALLIRQGYGFAYTFFPFKYSEQFTALEEEARSAGRGFWQYRLNT